MLDVTVSISYHAPVGFPLASTSAKASPGDTAVENNDPTPVTFLDPVVTDTVPVLYHDICLPPYEYGVSCLILDSPNMSVSSFSGLPIAASVNASICVSIGYSER